MTEYSMDLTCLDLINEYVLRFSRTNETYFIISAKLIASSTPGIANAKSCIIEPIIPFESAKEDKNLARQRDPNPRTLALTLFDHFLDSAGRINFHCE